MSDLNEIIESGGRADHGVAGGAAIDGAVLALDLHIVVPQLGRVLLHDDVEIGANSTIDRGSAGDTVIGAGSRLYNLVQIGHNVVLGRLLHHRCASRNNPAPRLFVICASRRPSCDGWALKIGDGAQIGAQAGVISDVDPGARLLGSPSRPVRDFFRQIAILKKLSAKRSDA